MRRIHYSRGENPHPEEGNSGALYNLHKGSNDEQSKDEGDGQRNIMSLNPGNAYNLKLEDNVINYDKEYCVCYCFLN